jgi:hypothetical protein
MQTAMYADILTPSTYAVAKHQNLKLRIFPTTTLESLGRRERER